MQSTRQHILDYLKEHNQATVDELAGVLQLTSVTVRHHLDILRSEGLVSDPVAQHRTTRGRPHHVFTLTPQAASRFPNNYDELTNVLLAEVKTQLAVNVVFEGMARRMTAEAPFPNPAEPLEARLNRAVTFLNARGYDAHWERTTDGYLLHTHNCPYAGVVAQHHELCGLDTALVQQLLGVTPRPVQHIAGGAPRCSYLLAS